MHKKNIFLFLMLLFSIEILNAQNYLVNYNFNYINDSLNKLDVKSEEMIVRIYDDGFVFMPKNDFRNDTIIVDVANLLENGKIDMKSIYDKYGKTDNNVRFFYNKSTNKYLIQANVFTTKTTFEDNVPLIEWKLSNETKKIKDYLAKKATANIFDRTWEAWYTEEIPISYGPYKFHGLPGLILEIKDSNDFFNFEFLSFNKSNSSIPKKLNEDRINISRKEFEDLQLLYKTDPIKLVDPNLQRINNVNDYNKNKKAKLELNNNSIERGIQFNLK